MSEIDSTNNVPSSIGSRVARLGWFGRLAIILSLLWLLICVAIGVSEHSGFGGFLIGALPLVLIWGLAWVIAGIKRARVETVSAPNAAERAENSASRNILYGSLTVLCVAAIYTYSISQEFGRDYLPVVVGESIGQGIVFGAVLGLVCGAIWRKIRWLVVSSMIASIGLAIAWNGINLANETRSIKEAALTLKSLMERMRAGDNIESSAFSDSKLRDFAPLAREIHEMSARNLERMTRMDKLPEGVLIANALDSESLRNPSALSASRRAATVYLAELIRSKNESLLDMDAMPARAEKMFANSAYKSSVLEGLRKSLPESRQSLAQQFDIQITMARDLEATLAFLSATDGKWVVQGKQVLFRNADDLAKYSEHQRKLAEDYASFQRVQSLASDRQRRKLDNMIPQ